MCHERAEVQKGLQRRIELITNILNIKGGHYDYKDITPKFRRNKPENNLELTQIATQLSGLLSTESRLQMLPWVENVHDEMEKLEEEKPRMLTNSAPMRILPKHLRASRTA